MRQGTPVSRLFIAIAFITGVALGSEGMWIYGKARLAQLLLQMSWRSALAGTPMKPWPWADTHAIARLDIEGETVIVLSGVSGRTMACGPGHLDGSAMPGDPGNCVITAHRDTHFARLRYVMPGDTIRLQRASGELVEYEVTTARVVGKNDTSVMRQSSGTRLTLITCYPFDAVIPGGPLRYVIVATARPEIARYSASRSAGTIPLAHQNTESPGESPARATCRPSRYRQSSRVPIA